MLTCFVLGLAGPAAASAYQYTYGDTDAAPVPGNGFALDLTDVTVRGDDSETSFRLSWRTPGTGSGGSSRVWAWIDSDADGASDFVVAGTRTGNGTLQWILDESGPGSADCESITGDGESGQPPSVGTAPLVASPAGRIETATISVPNTRLGFPLAENADLRLVAYTEGVADADAADRARRGYDHFPQEADPGTAANPADRSCDDDRGRVVRQSSGPRSIGTSAGDLEPSAAILVQPASPAAGQEVLLTPSIAFDDDAISFAWDTDDDGAFDDGTEPAAFAAYPSPGARTVRLRATDPGGREKVASATVEVVAAPNGPPQAKLAAPATAQTFETLTLDASGSADPDGRVVSFAFDLDGDGSFETGPAPSPIRNASFTAPGDRRIAVRVTDDRGATAEAEAVVAVSPRRPVARIVAGSAVIPGDQPAVTVALDASLSTDADGPLTKYEWDLDGNGDFETDTGTTAAAQVTYPAAGAKIVGLRVTDATGQTAEARETIPVTKAPPPLGPVVAPVPVDRNPVVEETDFRQAKGNPRGCEKYSKRRVGGLTLDGCFLEDAGEVRPVGPFRVNGLDFVPPAATFRQGGGLGARIVTRTGRLVSSTGYTVRAGTVELASQKLDSLIVEGSEADRAAGRTRWMDLRIGPDAKLFGFGLGANATVYVRGSAIEIEVAVDFPIKLLPKKIPGIQGQTTLELTPDHGLELDELFIEGRNIPFGPIVAKKFRVDYEARTGIWAGDLRIELPVPNKLQIGAGVEFDQLGLRELSGEARNINQAVGGPVFLQRIRVSVRIRPNVIIDGSVGLSVGPSIFGRAILNGTGSIAIAFPEPPAYNSIAIGASLDLLRLVTLANARAVFTDRPSFSLEAGLNLGFLGVGVDALIRGYVDPAAFELYGRGSISFLKVGAAGEGVISTRGIAGCTDKGKGFTYRFDPAKGPLDGDLEVFPLGLFSKCRVAPFRVPVAGRRQAAALARQATTGPVTVAVPAGQQVFSIEVTGDGGAPVVAFEGPGGQSYATIPNDIAGDETTWSIIANPKVSKTTIGLASPQAGTWTVRPLPGSAPVSAVQVSDGGPEIRASASIATTGASRSLEWQVTPVPGLSLTFTERDADGERPLFTTDRASGTHTFVPAGRPGEREVRVLVEREGVPVTVVPVAKYTAPAPLPPARPARLRARYSRGDLRVSWAPVAGADQYAVTARAGRRTVRLLAGATAPSVVVRGVTRRLDGRVTVRAIDLLGQRGRAATLRVGPRAVRCSRGKRRVIRKGRARCVRRR